MTNTEHYNYALEHNYTTEFMDRSLLINNGIDFIDVTKFDPDKAILMNNGTDVLLVDGVMSVRKPETFCSFSGK